MENMRELLRKQLGRSLQALSDLDRLRVAWTVACGKTMAERGRVIDFDGKFVTVAADDAAWLDQMVSMRRVLEQELALIAEVKLAGIHFTLSEGSGSERDERGSGNN